MEKIRQKKLFLLDMDGTLYIDQRLFDGAAEFLEAIKRRGGRYLFLTNNSSRSVGDYQEKMSRLGIPCGAEDFLTSSQATGIYLKQRHAGQTLYVFGTESLKQELRSQGFSVTDCYGEDVDCLVMGFDTELCFQKLEDACRLLNRGVPYIATNPDYVCPTWYGSVPDCGSVADMLKNATGRTPLFIGKPRPDMALLAMRKTGFSPEETVIIGDRLYTDIACGISAGIDAALVLSGEATLEDLAASEVKPTMIFRDVQEILGYLE